MKGRLTLIGPWSEDEGVRDWVAQLATNAEPEARKFQRHGQTVYLKASALAMRPAIRHALRKLLLRRPIPRLAELHNLNWLRDHDFDCPRPLLAASHVRAGLPVFQLLATEWLSDHLTLDEIRRRSNPQAARIGSRLFELLGEQVGRMHQLGFVHRDLFARNILVPKAGDPRVQFIDAWRGGARRQSRGPAYDLGCLFLDTADWLAREEQDAFLQAYRRTRGSGFADTHSRAWRRLLERAAAERRRLHSKLAANSQYNRAWTEWNPGS